MELLDSSTPARTEGHPSSALVAPVPLTKEPPQAHDIWETRRLQNWTWTVRRDAAWVLERSDAPDWLRLDRDSRATLIKTNDGRQVWRVHIGSRTVYAKVIRSGSRWRRLITGSASEGERRTAQYAADHNIPAISVLAAGESPLLARRQLSVLITAAVTDAIALDEFWSNLDPLAPSTRAVKNQVIDAAARLIAQAHQNGFEHFDLHAGNVLIQPAADGSRRALFVDLHNVRAGRRVTERAVIRNLAQFNQWFSLRAPTTDRLRFLDRYLYWRDLLTAEASHPCRLTCDRRQLLTLIEAAADQHARALYAKRDRRAMRDGRYFARLDLPRGWEAHVFLSAKHPLPGSRASQVKFTKQQWSVWLKDPLSWVTPADSKQIIKETPSVKVCRGRLVLDDGEVIDVVAKQARPNSLRRRLRSLFQGSRSLRTWRRAHALLHRQIATAKPLAVAERRSWGIVRDSLIITECVHHATDLDTLLTMGMRQLEPGRARWLKRALSYHLACLVQRLDEACFYHRDFKAPNVLVQWDPAAVAEPRVLLVDLDGLHQCRRQAPQRTLQSLMRLNVSLDHCKRVTRTDRLRFLKDYLQRSGIRGDWKPVWRDLARLSEEKRRRRARVQELRLKKFGRV